MCKSPKEDRRGTKWSLEELEVVYEWCPQNAKYASELLGISRSSTLEKPGGYYYRGLNVFPVQRFCTIL